MKHEQQQQGSVAAKHRGNVTHGVLLFTAIQRIQL